MSSLIYCRICAKPVDKGAPATADDITFVCEECGVNGYPQNGWVNPKVLEKVEAANAPAPTTKPSLLKRLFGKK